LDSPATFELDEKTTGAGNPAALDCYKVMQLSPNADPETISRVYRTLALRYHPDNTETGNHELFLRLSEAYEILSSPETRPTYNSDRPAERNLEVATAAYLGVNSLGHHACWEG
jgi:DnaJ-class molecular chaperone